MLSWSAVNATVDGGVIVDTGYDPRNGLFFNPNPDGGQSDGGAPDAGDGGGRNPGGGGGPPSPGIPIDNSSCSTAGGAASLLPVAALGLLALALRTRRSR